MQTVAWFFLLIAVVIFRQVSKGRVQFLVVDLRDFFLALTRNDQAAMKEIASRSGEGLDAVSVDTSAVGDSTAVSAAAGAALGVSGSSTANGAALLAEARKLGTAAGHHYSWGATGPTSYDCSGLVWRAARNIGVYKGARFTTHTFTSVAKGWATEVNTPAIGDVVLWGEHMGIVSGTDRYYSALSSKTGILEGSIKAHPGTPSYWRVK